MAEYVATVTTCVQVGEKAYRAVNVSKIFRPGHTLKQITDWAETHGVKSLSLIQISELE